jgi:hypothetical protein
MEVTMEILDQRGHPEQVIARYQRRLKLLEQQRAHYGMQTDPSVIMEIEDIQRTLAEIRATDLRPPAPATLYTLAEQAAPPAKYRGLVVLVGPGRAGVNPITQAAGAAIQHHLAEPPSAGLAHCWLLPSGVEQFEASASKAQRDAIDVARELAQRCAEQGVQAHIRPVGAAFSAQETYDLVQWIFAADLPDDLAEHEVICDFTGGTKLMSAGMILACGERRPMQCMVFGADDASVPLLVRFAPRDGG